MIEKISIVKKVIGIESEKYANKSVKLVVTITIISAGMKYRRHYYYKMT